jgi:hypothetical protein
MENTETSKTGIATIVFLCLIGIISLMVIFQFFGMKSLLREEKTTWVNNQEASEKHQPRKVAQHTQHSEADDNADKTLKSIAKEFHGPTYGNIRTANVQNNWGLSDDEAKFYDGLRTAKNADATAENWLSKVKKAHQTYKTVKEVFGGKSDVQAMMQDAQSAVKTMNQLNRIYGISIRELETFAPQAKTLSDWAHYIENNKANGKQ